MVLQGEYIEGCYVGDYALESLRATSFIDAFRREDEIRRTRFRVPAFSLNNLQVLRTKSGKYLGFSGSIFDDPPGVDFKFSFEAQLGALLVDRLISEEEAVSHYEFHLERLLKEEES